MNANLRAIMHKELDILLNAVEYFEDDSVCCPTLKVMSEKMLGGEDVDDEEQFACVVYESEFVAQVDGNFVLEERVRKSELYHLTATGSAVDVPYSTEIVEILDDGTEGGAIG